MYVCMYVCKHAFELVPYIYDSNYHLFNCTPKKIKTSWTIKGSRSDKHLHIHTTYTHTYIYLHTCISLNNNNNNVVAK